MKVGVQYAQEHKPAVWVLENVPTLARYKKFRSILKGLVSAMERLGYEVHVDVLDTRSFGLPQSRKRMLIVALLKDKIIRQFQWPSGVPNFIPLSKLLEPFNACTDKAGRLPNCAREAQQVRRAYRQAYKLGIDARSEEIIVDARASSKFFS